MKQNATSLKAVIRNLAKEKNIAAQVLLQNYIFERILERLSHSKYNDKYVVKGGILVAAIVGIDTRSTMDIDVTLRNLNLTEENVRRSLTEICAIVIDDGCLFKVGDISPIRADDLYGGYKVKVLAFYGTMEIPLSIDVSTGDAITPAPVRYTWTGILDESKSIELWAYNIETVIAEKLETILRRNTLNTRPRDFYDVYILFTTKQINYPLLREALMATADHRETRELIADTATLLSRIEDSKELSEMWDKYRKQFPYANNITYEQIVIVLRDIIDKLEVL
jgi:predicted nucleotidyltransferase component of viral defense system